ncbi:MAG: aldose 1-epimerase [Bacteroidales bacterium]|nr:aldose 1-epimerase [Bacteroidales bacterium]
MYIRKSTYNGVESVEFSAGGYSSIMIPSMGANVVSLKNTDKGIDILHSPRKEDMETFFSRPQIFGIPVLFPPNRIADGIYSWNGKTYHYPITIQNQNCYHHGILKSLPFTVTRTEINKDSVEVEAAFFSNMINDGIYQNFPHLFQCRINVMLSSEGLSHTITFINDGEDEMPLGVGFHTPINIPFEKGKGEYKMWLSAGEEWELNERTLPTEKLLAISGEFTKLRGDGMNPVGEAIEKGFTNKPIFMNGKEYNGAIFQNTKTGNAVFYETDDCFGHWTVWNNGGDKGYMCAEPQTWAINAPNLSLDADITGFRVLEGGDAWSATTKLYVK